MYYLYILYSRVADKFYVGHTDDPDRRLAEHNNPLVRSKYTSAHLPWTLEAVIEIGQDRGLAMKVERFVKKQKRRAFIRLCIEKQKEPDFIGYLIRSAG